MRWAVGDREPSNRDIREVTGKSGRVWARSKPNGLWWYPRAGGRIHHWPELLRADGPLTGEPAQLGLFEVSP